MDLGRLELAMIEYLLETLRKEKGKTYDDIAGYVYGTENIQQSRLRLYRLRKPAKSGSPKKLTFEDFVRICEAVDESPVEVLAQWLSKAKRGEI